MAVISATVDSASLIDIAPDSITGDAQVTAAIAGIDPQLRAAAAARDVPAVLHRFDSLTSAQLDHIAYHFDAPAWSDTWTLAMKRSVIRSVFEIRRHLGTRHAVQQAIASIGGQTSITEWWETDPQGTPHTFSINVMLSGFDAVDVDTQETVQRLVEAAKPVRSHYDMNIIAGFTGGEGGDGRARAIVETRISNI